MKFIPALFETDLVNGETVGLEIDQHFVLIAKHENNFYAFKNQCAHLKYPLTDAELVNGELTCSLHHWSYDIKTGHGKNPNHVSLCAYPVKVLHGRIYVGIGEKGIDHA